MTLPCDLPYTDPAQIVDIDSDKQSGLLINDVPTLNSGFESPQPVSLSARQKRVDTGEETIPIPIDFVMERLEPITSEDPAKIIIPVKFTIVGFGGQPVKVDTLSIDILQTPDLMKVMRVERVPFAETPGAQSCEGERAWSLCRVRAIITHRVVETMRMMRTKAHQAKGWVKHCGGRHHGHHRHRAHRWAKMLHSALRFFIIPALLGVIGGLLASAVGMLVGQFIVLLWTQFHRRGQRGPLRTEVVEIIVSEDEKDGLLDAQYEDDGEGLPEYEHAPRYEDVEAQVDVDRDAKE